MTEALPKAVLEAADVSAVSQLAPERRKSFRRIDCAVALLMAISAVKPLPKFDARALIG